MRFLISKQYIEDIIDDVVMDRFFYYSYEKYIDKPFIYIKYAQSLINRQIIYQSYYLYLVDEIDEWLSSQGIDYKIEYCDEEIESEWFIEFTDIDDAILFKLAWL